MGCGNGALVSSFTLLLIAATRHNDDKDRSIADLDDKNLSFVTSFVCSGRFI